MARPGEARYTLAQYARRVGMSDSRARALQSAGRLAGPDGSDPDGRPYWHARTIDAWCRRTQRAVPDDADWPIDWAPAQSPVPIIERRDVVVEGRDPQSVSVIVYDTPHGHVVYVMRHTDFGLSAEMAARAAANVLHPAFWSDAVVLVPESILFGMTEEHHSIEAFRLRAPQTEAPAAPWLPRFLAGRGPGEDRDAPIDPQRVETVYIGYVGAGEIQEVLGRPVPMWYYRTCTPDAVRLMQAYGESGTITVPDTTTTWPATRDRIAAAVDAEAHLRYPHAFRLRPPRPSRPCARSRTATAAASTAAKAGTSSPGRPAPTGPASTSSTWWPPPPPRQAIPTPWRRNCPVCGPRRLTCPGTSPQPMRCGTPRGSPASPCIAVTPRSSSPRPLATTSAARAR